MAGHSKWANIQHRKKAQDAKRSKLFTKLIREIVVAAKAGGGDLDANPRLRLAVDKALAGNMTRDTIQRAIDRGANTGDAGQLDEIRYEGYGPEGVAVLVECLTDNRNRTVAEVRHAFTKSGGNLGTEGSVSYLFETWGVLIFEPGVDEDSLFEKALEAGAEDVINHPDGSCEVRTEADQFLNIKDALAEAGLTPFHAEVMRLPTTSVALAEEAYEKVTRLIDHLEDLDDVQNVFHNAEPA